MERENIIIVALVVLIIIVAGAGILVTGSGIHLNKDPQVNTTNITHKNVTKNIKRGILYKTAKPVSR